MKLYPIAMLLACIVVSEITIAHDDPRNGYKNNWIIGCSTDSIYIGINDRGYFMKALEIAFGKHAKDFGYTPLGYLVYKGDTKTFSKGELDVFRQLNTIMSEKVITNLIYDKNYILSRKGFSDVIDPSKSGGEATASIKENPGLDQNYIVIDPKWDTIIEVRELTAEYYIQQKELFNKTNVPDEKKEKAYRVILRPLTNLMKVKTNTENGTWHGLGHIIYAGKTLDHVIDFDNAVRRITKKKNLDGSYSPAPLKDRNYDESHNRTIIWYLQ